MKHPRTINNNSRIAGVRLKWGALIALYDATWTNETRGSGRSAVQSIALKHAMTRPLHETGRDSILQAESTAPNVTAPRSGSSSEDGRSSRSTVSTEDSEAAVSPRASDATTLNNEGFTDLPGYQVSRRSLTHCWHDKGLGG